MFWNEAKRQWQRHPQCHCDRDPCICAWLDPLDTHGRPIPNTISAAMRRAMEEGSDPRQVPLKGVA